MTKILNGLSVSKFSISLPPFFWQRLKAFCLRRPYHAAQDFLILITRETHCELLLVSAQKGIENLNHAPTLKELRPFFEHNPHLPLCVFWDSQQSGYTFSPLSSHLTPKDRFYLWQHQKKELQRKGGLWLFHIMSSTHALKVDLSTPIAHDLKHFLETLENPLAALSILSIELAPFYLFLYQKFSKKLETADNLFVINQEFDGHVRYTAIIQKKPVFSRTLKIESPSHPDFSQEMQRTFRYVLKEFQIGNPRSFATLFIGFPDHVKVHLKSCIEGSHTTWISPRTTHHRPHVLKSPLTALFGEWFATHRPQFFLKGLPWRPLRFAFSKKNLLVWGAQDSLSSL